MRKFTPAESASQNAAALQRLHIKRWERLAPHLLSQILNSREEATTFLAHNEASTRQVAVEALRYYWNVLNNESIRSEVERLAFADSSPEVRSSAILALAAAHRGTDDVRIGNLLAITVCDERTPDAIRWCAYEGLFTLRRMIAPLWRGFRTRPRTKPRLPDDIDWPFVNSFLSSTRTALAVDQFELLPEGMRSRYRSLYRGITAYECQAFEEAIVHLTAALGEKPDAVGALYRRGDAYLQTGNLDAAIADFTRVINLLPTPAALRRRAEAYRKKGMLDLAEQDLQTAAGLEDEKVSGTNGT